MIDIDRPVAEKVWRLRHESTLSINGRFSWAKNDGWWIAARDESGWERFLPSTNIAHAWEVVDKLRAGGYVVRINTDSEGAMCRIFNHQGDETASDHAETTPLAICRAALLLMANR